MIDASEVNPIRAYAAMEAGSIPEPWQYQPRALRADDVDIKILYCGICHTDIHFVDDDWARSEYPLVPGHEIIGRVSAVGDAVERFAPGDLVGVGCLVDACRHCDSCEDGLEQYCLEGATFTYNNEDRHDGRRTYGGYAERILVSERFVLRLPDGLEPASAAPILCAGITTYSPLRHVDVQPGDRVGVVGMGGLGHMGIKFAVAMGAEVTVFTRTEAKLDEAQRHGAHRVVVSGDEAQLADAAASLDVVLDTVPVAHDLNPYLQCLGVDGTYIVVGQLTPFEPALDAGQLIFARRSVMGSLIGGLAETQEVLDFCAEHGITCDVEMLDIRDLDEAYERMKRGDVRYRFVIDMATLQQA
jgi:uncharacterized zinc-type alcohol dehydrogenase-like protein